MPNTDPPNTYRHCVDNEIRDFLDGPHADRFLNFINSITEDLQYTVKGAGGLHQEFLEIGIFVVSDRGE